MNNLAGPGFESPVRRYVIDSTSNTEHTPPPVAVNRLKGLLKSNTLIAKSQESADHPSPKKTGAKKKELAVKIQSGATITLCSSCVTKNKIEEKVQPKRRRSVAKDEGEEKPKRTNKKKPDETSEAPVPKEEKKTRAKKETAEKISKPRNTRMKATDNKENELAVNGNADSLSSNEAQTENEHQQLTQDEENNNKKTRKPRAVKPKNTSKKDSETEETAKKSKKPRHRNAEKNTDEENIEPGLENMNVTDLVSSIMEKNKAELAHNNEMSEESTGNPVMEDDHITKRIQKKSSKNTVDKKKPKQNIAKKNDISHENSQEVFKDLNITDQINSINEKIKIDEVTSSTLKESSFGSLFSNDHVHMKHSQNSNSSILHKKQEIYATNTYKEKLRKLDQRMKTTNTSQQNSDSTMDNMNVTELFNDIYEQNKTQDDIAGSQGISSKSSVSKEVSQSEVTDSKPHNTSQISKNQGAIKKVILAKDKKTKDKKMNVNHDNTGTQKLVLDESKSKTLKRNISNKNVEPEYHAENLNNLNMKSEPNDNHDNSSNYNVNDDGEKTGYKKKLGLDYKLQVVEADSSKKMSKSKTEKSSDCSKKEKSSRCNKKTKSKRHLSQEENQVSSAKTKRERRKSLKQLKKQRTVSKAVEELNKQFANIHIGKIGQLHIGSQLADLDSDSSSECSSSCSCWDRESSCTCCCDDDSSSWSPSSSDCSDSETVYTSSTDSSSSESETTESESSGESEREYKKKHKMYRK